MRIIQKPVDEDVFLAAVGHGATAEEVYQGIIARAECCVVHLCGCGWGGR